MNELFLQNCHFENKLFKGNRVAGFICKTVYMSEASFHRHRADRRVDGILLIIYRHRADCRVDGILLLI